MAENQVTLTFAGDTSKLDKAFSSVGASAGKMSTKVEESSGKMAGLGESTDRTATKAGTASGAFGAFGGAAALSDINMNSLTGKLMAGQIAFDLLSGASDLLTIALESNVVKTIASKAATLAASAATKAYAAAQWLLNAAMDANPVGLIVIAIVALIAVVVLIATKTTWFQTAWKKSWGAIKSAAITVWDWLKDLPGKLGKAFDKVKDLVSKPFKAAFNAVSDAWNNTVGKLSFHIPSWVPLIGGKGFDVPDLPKFHQGGIIPGAPGSEMLAVLQAGERVTPAGQTGGTVYVSAGDSITAGVFAAIRQEIASRYGGDVTIALAGAR